LSAELDGDLEAAASDFGLSASEALAQLRATPGVDARRTALRRARDLIATRPHIDPAVEDGLVVKAMARDDLTTVRERRGRRERQWRVLVAAGSVAAAIAVIVGVRAMPSSDNASKASTAGPVSSALGERAQSAKDGVVPTSPAGGRPDLGDVTNAAALRIPARRLLSQPATTTAGQSDGTAKAAGPLPADSAAPEGTGYSSFRKALPGCADAADRYYDASTPPALIASGTVSGAPVIILLYRGPGSPYADVIRVGDCTLVRRQPLG